MVNILSFFIALFFFTSSARAQEVQNISLLPIPQPNGSSVIDVTWDPPADIHRLKEYRIYQIRGIGEGISSPQTLSAAVSALRITDVPPGPFGVSIQIVWKDGLTSHGAFASIGHDTIATSKSPLVASVISASSPLGLSSADLGMVIFVILAGAIVGTFSVRLFHRA